MNKQGLGRVYGTIWCVALFAASRRRPSFVTSVHCLKCHCVFIRFDAFITAPKLESWSYLLSSVEYT